MRQMKLAILLLVIDLTVLFNIKRFSLGEENSIDIQPLFYALGFAAVVLILIIPFLRQMNVWALLLLWNGIGFSLRMILFNQRPLFGDFYTYLSISEATLISLTVVLAQRVANHIHDFEEAIENITFGIKGNRVRNKTDATRDIQDELTRSRRHNHPLSLIVIETKPDTHLATLNRAVKQAQQTMLERYVTVSLGRIIADLLRRTDLVISEEEYNRFILLCPETDLPEAHMLTERIRTLILARLGVEVNCGIGSFPAEALTFEELVHQAEKRIGQPSSEITSLAKTNKA